MRQLKVLLKAPSQTTGREGFFRVPALQETPEVLAAFSVSSRTEQGDIKIDFLIAALNVIYMTLSHISSRF